MSISMEQKSVTFHGVIRLDQFYNSHKSSQIFSNTELEVGVQGTYSSILQSMLIGPDYHKWRRTYVCANLAYNTIRIDL